MTNDWNFMMRYTKEEIDQAIKDRKWPPSKMMCKICKTELQSQYPGHFVGCKCGASFVDQTPYYSRYGGEVVEFSEDESSDKSRDTDGRGGRDAE